MERPRRVALGVGVSLVVLLCGLFAGGAAQAKKKGGGKKGIAIKTQQVNAPIPDRATGPGTQLWGTLRSTITLPKKYKGLTVGDVNVTIQTVGSAPGAAEDLTARLTAPNGDTTSLFFGLAGQNIGPLTLDDETRQTLCHDPTPPCGDPDSSLNVPYLGEAAPDGRLSFLDGGKMRGSWTLSVFDTDGGPPGLTSSLVFWKLSVTAAKNVRVST